MAIDHAVSNKEKQVIPFSLRVLSLIILIIAIGVSGYLSYLKVSDTSAVCLDSGKFDCGTVLNSSYSELIGLPISWLGLATNLIVLTLLLLQNRIALLQQFGATLIFGVVLFAFVFSVYLVYLQAFVIKAYCPWCLSHEALITLLFIVSALRVRQVLVSQA